MVKQGPKHKSRLSGALQKNIRIKQHVAVKRAHHPDGWQGSLP